MKTVAIMPLKLKNERCPGKNTRILGNKPLFRYELDNLLETGAIDSVFVFCSSEEIIALLPDYAIFLKRSEDLDLPTSNFNQIFSAFSEIVDADIYIYAHATAPFVSKDTMLQCINAVKSGQYDSAFCARKIQTFLWKNGKPLNFNSANLPRTQDLEPIYAETSGIYVFTKEVFQKYNRRIGNNPFIKCVSYRESIDIDYPEDFNIAELFLTADN